MAATRDKFRPRQLSERFHTPMITCSLVSWYTANQASHLGENLIRGTGAPYGLTAMKNEFAKAWRAVKQEGDKGYGTSDFDKFMGALGSPVTLSQVKFVRDKEDIRKALGAGHVITMAGNVGKTPAGSPLRDDVNPVDHRMAFKDLKRINNVWYTRKYDPMTPQGSRRWGQWVKLSHVFAFGSRFEHWGRFLAERFVTGHWTREAKARRAAAKSLANIQQRVVDLQLELQECRNVVSNKQGIIDALKLELAGVRAALADCQSESTTDTQAIEAELLEIENNISAIRAVL